MIKRVRVAMMPIAANTVIPWNSLNFRRYNMFDRGVLEYYLCTREYHVPWRIAFKKGNVYKLPNFYNTNSFKKLNSKSDVLIALNKYGGKLITEEEEQ